MAEKKKYNDKTVVKKDMGDFPLAYMRLRTILDGLEISSLRYALKDKTTAKRIKRIGELEEMIMPIIRSLQGKTLAPGGDATGCGEGYFNCGGVCVPYQCPISK